MCGIFGIVGEHAKQSEKIPAMTHALAKRGPDDHGTLSLSGCILGQTRLSIIDIEGGHQPMYDSQNGLAITFNGEIYNYKQLKRELETKGHTFSTHSDTEVILKAYREYGKECTQKLDGMFAFAIWDEKRSELFVARDRFGKKPFFYAHDADGCLVFASEIKAVVAAGIRGEIDPSAIEAYLALRYIPPWKTVYKNIHVLLPAHCAVYTNGTFTQEKYWQLTSAPLHVSYNEAKDRVRELLDSAVRKRMLAADVEVGSLLSGGVDSTLISAYAARSLSKPLKTFAIGYEEHINELPYAQEASEKIGATLFTFQAKGSLLSELEAIIAYMDEPHGDSSDLAQHLISKLAASHVKVALSGDGADELFMGYGWYWKHKHERKIVQLKNALFSNPFREHIRRISVFSEKERRSLWKDQTSVSNTSLIPSWATLAHGDVVDINLFDLTTYLPGQLLTKVDRASMLHSLEIRCPFLDTELAEYVFNLPETYKMDGMQGKIILKDILTEIMPKEFVYRRKQGFGAPVLRWLLEKEVQTYVDGKLGQGAHIYEFLDEKGVRELWQRFLHEKREDDAHKIWSLLCLELWCSTRAL